MMVIITIKLYGVDLSLYYHAAGPIYFVLANIIATDFFLREVAMSDRCDTRALLAPGAVPAQGSCPASTARTLGPLCACATARVGL